MAVAKQYGECLEMLVFLRRNRKRYRYSKSTAVAKYYGFERRTIFLVRKGPWGAHALSVIKMTGVSKTSLLMFVVFARFLISTAKFWQVNDHRKMQELTMSQSKTTLSRSRNLKGPVLLSPDSPCAFLCVSACVVLRLTNPLSRGSTLRADSPRSHFRCASSSGSNLGTLQDTSSWRQRLMREQRRHMKAQQHQTVVPHSGPRPSRTKHLYPIVAEEVTEEIQNSFSRYSNGNF